MSGRPPPITIPQRENSTFSNPEPFIVNFGRHANPYRQLPPNVRPDNSRCIYIKTLPNKSEQDGKMINGQFIPYPTMNGGIKKRKTIKRKLKKRKTSKRKHYRV